MSDLRRTFDSFDRGLKLHNERCGVLYILLERRNVIWRESTVRAKRDGYDVLALRVNENKRRTRRLVFINDKSRNDAVALQPRGRFASKKIVTDFSDKRTCALFSRKPRYGNRLVSALTAGIHKKFSSAHRLAGNRYLLTCNNHIGIRGT